MKKSFTAGALTFTPIGDRDQYMVTDQVTRAMLGLVNACGADPSEQCSRTRGIVCGKWHTFYTDGDGNAVMGSFYSSAQSAGEALRPIGSGVTLTQGQLEEWARRKLTPGDLDRLDEAIPNSSIPDAVCAIVDSWES